MRLARRMQRLGTETAFDVLVRARALEAQGQAVVHLEMGEPDFDSPAAVVAAGQRALAEGLTHYGFAPGVTITRCGSISMRRSRASHTAIASRSSGRPAAGP